MSPNTDEKCLLSFAYLHAVADFCCVNRANNSLKPKPGDRHVSPTNYLKTLLYPIDKNILVFLLLNHPRTSTDTTLPTII